MDEIYEQIKNERKRQDAKWGEQNHNVFVWLSILGEEAINNAEGILRDMRETFHALQRLEPGVHH